MEIGCRPEKIRKIKNNKNIECHKNKFVKKIRKIKKLFKYNVI